LKRRGDIVRRHLRAVGKFCLGAQPERHRHAVGGNVGGLGNEPVDGIGFVGGRCHQRVEQHFKALGLVALQDVLVQTVEGVRPAGAHRHEAPALGRVRIDVVEMLEVRGVLQVAENRQAMTRLGRCNRAAGTQHENSKQRCRKAGENPLSPWGEGQGEGAVDGGE